ncbi:MAG TPA: hypothetical protein PKK82_00290 [Anaerolineaceae bacterium]|nr:hypothetical protein [Chloroflexota bacterium]HNY83267.1 hypothetical protein [Anaerolineaceae bacterium]
MPLLTLFSAPKPMTNPHIATIQRNAFASWKALGDEVEVALIGTEDGLAEAAREFGFKYLPHVARNALGTPLISSIFYLGRGVNTSPYLVYVNADIILFPEILKLTRQVGEQLSRFLIVGQRYDLEVKEALKFEEGWAEELKQRLQSEGTLHPRAGSDYFIFPRATFDQIPEFSVGRAGWDNWMIYRARKMSWPVVDGTRTMDIIHQNHDYSHLPGGQSHYRLPETGDNIRLAGGRRTIFDLNDATDELVDGVITPIPSNWARFWRRVETTPLLKWRGYGLTQFLFSLFHPKRAWSERKKDRAMRAEHLRKQAS